MKINIPLLVNQQDSRWSNNLLGNNTDPHYNFYNYACLIACLDMVAWYYGHTIDLPALNDLLKEKKAYPEGSGVYVWGGLPKVFSDISEKKIDTPDVLTGEQVNEIKQAIDLGYPVMALLDYNPRTVEPNFHYVLIIGYNPADENDFTIADPIGGRVHSLKDYLGWFKQSARATIEQYAIYIGNVPKVTADSIVIPIEINESNVFKASQWDEIVQHLEAGDPRHTMAQTVKNVINGIRSQTTTAQNNERTAVERAGVAETEIENRKEQVRKLEELLLDEQTRHKEEIRALQDMSPTVEKLRKHYEGTIQELTDKYLEEGRQKGKALNDLAACRTSKVTTEKQEQMTPIDTTQVNTILGLVTKLIKLFLTKI